ncbi:hypothetical protein F2Q70_00015672 [Brassica cretica]|uniref:Uncharacterized protein n=1 Tax=Brassica cretica TaxID=69181 RepID=A0A8S9HZF4_BRACR|nr:hypothetical protein F2Q70_00015672 [Brassica cretica]KAF2578288.1 hypothetical protein F2Q68_00005924 [Brassica cretica]
MPPEVSGLRTIEADSKIACSCVEFIPKVAVRAFSVVRNISQIFEYRCVIVLIVRRQVLLGKYDLDASAVSWLLFVS